MDGTFSVDLDEDVFLAILGIVATCRLLVVSSDHHVKFIVQFVNELIATIYIIYTYQLRSYFCHCS